MKACAANSPICVQSRSWESLSPHGRCFRRTHATSSRRRYTLANWFWPAIRASAKYQVRAGELRQNAEPGRLLRRKPANNDKKDRVDVPFCGTTPLCRCLFPQELGAMHLDSIRRRTRDTTANLIRKNHPGKRSLDEGGCPDCEASRETLWRT